MATKQVSKNIVSLSGEDLRLYLQHRFPTMTEQEMNNFVNKIGDNK